jgi:CheY-like chemotaxis protein
MASESLPDIDWRHRVTASLLVLAIVAPLAAFAMSSGLSETIVLPVTLVVSAMTTAAVARRERPRAQVAELVTKVLLVNELTTPASVMESALTEEGYLVTAVSSAAEAIELLKFREMDQTDLVVLDLKMPDSTGADIIAYMRTGPRIAVIVLEAKTVEAGRSKRATEVRVIESTASAATTSRFAKLLAAT